MQRLFLLVLLSICGHSFAQHTNAWILHGQPYFKIPVGRDALYKLNYNSLINAGLSGPVDPGMFQLFHRGQEQAIYVHGEQDGVFDPSDFIEFYGLKNDGTLDNYLYKSPDAQPHGLYNLFSDTTSYFLTVGTTAGKRIQRVEVSDPDNYAVIAHHIDQRILILTDKYTPGKDHGDIQEADILLSAFDKGEGWTGIHVQKNNTAYYSIDQIQYPQRAVGRPKLEVLIVGAGKMSHAVELLVGNRSLAVVNFDGYDTYTYNTNLDWDDISTDGVVRVGIRPLGVGQQHDVVSIGYIIVRYPQQLDMGNATQKLLTFYNNEARNVQINVNGATSLTRMFDVTEPANVKCIRFSGTDALYRSRPQTSQKILLTDHTITPSIKKIAFRKILAGAQDYIIVTHPSLRKPTGGYTDPVLAYAEYRSLPHGGGYTPLVVNVTELYDQFSYGEQSPLAIYEFAKFLATGKLPSYLFLVGKGLEVSHKYYRRPSDFASYKDLVPTAGFPASDMLFTAGLAGIPNVPAIATGRLSATEPQDVAAYLDKVKHMESMPYNNLRRKNILHLSGGIFPGEPQEFKHYLTRFASLAENRFLGGHVESMAKESSADRVISVADELNAGLSLITFFGHSAPNTTDFDIGNPSDPGYHNTIYPMMLMNGCLSGSFFMNNSVYGEKWVNTRGRGAIGYIAHSWYSIASMLEAYSSLFYEIGYGDAFYINKGIGDVQKEVAARLLEKFSSGQFFVPQAQQMVLLGDPSIKLFGAGKPDYEINSQKVVFESFNNDVTASSPDSFKLNLLVRNFGISPNEKLRIEVKRIVSDHTEYIYDSLYNAVFYSDTLTFIIREKEKKHPGENQFLIRIDADDAFEELSEENNVADFKYFIPLNATLNLYPAAFGIVNTSKVDLLWQHSDLLSEAETFLLELDTVGTFDSPYKQTFVVNGGPWLSQQIELLSTDSTAYYWRTKLEDTNTIDNWSGSSFTYIRNGSSGWAQVHHDQFKGNDLSGLVSDSKSQMFEFKSTINTYNIGTFSEGVLPLDSVNIILGGVEYNIRTENAGCRENTLNLIAFNKQTTNAYPGIYLTWKDIRDIYNGRRIICGREPYVINSFRDDELIVSGRADLLTYIDNVGLGDSVLLFSIGDVNPSVWPSTALDKLKEVGIHFEQLSNLRSGEPFLIRARKGTTPGSAEIFTPTGEDGQRLRIQRTISGRTLGGEMTSVKIGPAAQWGAFNVTYSNLDATDRIMFTVSGITHGGVERVLKQKVTQDSSLSDINAIEYPYLKVSMNLSDSVFQTPAMFKKWLITFEPAPEGLLLFDGSTNQITVAEGQSFDMNYRFVNISSQSFADSLDLEFKIINRETHNSKGGTKKILPPAPGDTTHFTITFATISQSGINDVEMIVNPRTVPEQYYYNNHISLKDHVDVTPDRFPPVLGVTFDDRYIRNNEYVFSNPKIKIRIWDANQHMPIKDTTGISIQLAYPCTGGDDCDFNIYFSRDGLAWYAATDTSDFYVEFSPVFEEGRYTLTVDASDASGNKSGSNPFAIDFQVAKQTYIEIDPPHPNPFTNQLRLSFRVNGDELPDKMNLRLWTLDGRLIYDQISEALETQKMINVGENELEFFVLSGEMHEGLYLYDFCLYLGDKKICRNGKLILKK